MRIAQLAPMVLGVISCQGRVLQVAAVGPTPYRFGPPTAVKELASSSHTENPTLTGDLLQIFFTTDRSSTTGGDVWFAQRSSVVEPFGAPAPVPEVNTDSFETSAAISTDGLTLWLGSDRPGGAGGVDIWVSERISALAGWSAPVNLVALNSSADDIPRPPGQHDLVMPLASKAVTAASPGGETYQTYRATRANRGAPFAPPVAIPGLDYEVDRSTVDAFLTDDGLALFFSSTPARAPDVDGGAEDADGGGSSPAATTADLFVAFRPTTDQPFMTPQPLSELNTAYDERDPWLSPDETILYFTSDRDGTLNIYSVAVTRR